jgi:galactoside O-acetyltransferase
MAALFGPSAPEDLRDDYRGPITIGAHCWVGANSVIMPNVEIPDGVVIGALSFVRSGTILSPWTVCAGIPARVIKFRDRKPVLAAYEKLQARGIK